MLEKLLEWDRNTFVYLNSLGIETYDAFWTIITQITTWIPLFIIFFLLLVLKFPKKKAFHMFLTVLVLVGFVLLFTFITKEYVARLRPSNDVELNALIRILHTPTDYSFFSGHAASSFAITTLIVLFLRRKIKWVWLFYLWPVLFSASRIYVGVHFPLDILVGVLVGTLSAIAIYTIHVRITAPSKG
ncbi:phosphatase PAP2 family protein [Arenibacter sp. GZD96]|uniref:phosphatase PAP2 family protein n=1 Tax=Aurantibrevibacter litoralis TaxID=3106030 RepID=UPI002AFE2893|nr:phosphatase PAP2 family protein [Arenibacter sp. GZD-96]MEA1786691.1 phosphatase PAP2 family protein [Arenibacter sp. GZD-96]